MRASHILRKLLRRCIVQIHAVRAATLLAAIDALVRCGHASLTAIGRALSAATTAKHRIKRIDRLFGNLHLQSELLLWYGVVAARLIAGSERPIILIDWTEINHNWWSLTAAIPVAGRAIPVYNEVHPPSGNGSARQIRRFVRTLRQLIPQRVNPTLIADAGFTKPFFEACWEYGFHVVVRLRGRSQLRTWSSSGVESVTSAHALAAQSSRRARHVGQWYVYDANRRGERLQVVVAKRTGLRRRRGDGQYRKQAVEPWVLGTTRRDLTASEVVALYALRMRIEELFRDAKNPRFGWSLAHTNSQSPARLRVLLLIVSLAILAVVLVGIAARDAGCARFLQANTTRDRAVLSVFRLGDLMFAEFGARMRLTRFTS